MNLPDNFSHAIHAAIQQLFRSFSEDYRFILAGMSLAFLFALAFTVIVIKLIG